MQQGTPRCYHLIEKENKSAATDIMWCRLSWTLPPFKWEAARPEIEVTALVILQPPPNGSRECHWFNIFSSKNRILFLLVVSSHALGLGTLLLLGLWVSWRFFRRPANILFAYLGPSSVHWFKAKKILMDLGSHPLSWRTRRKFSGSHCWVTYKGKSLPCCWRRSRIGEGRRCNLLASVGRPWEGTSLARPWELHLTKCRCFRIR